MDKIDQLEIMVAEARVEAAAFYEKGNKSDGTRLRNRLQAVKVLATQIRTDVREIKNAD